MPAQPLLALSLAVVTTGLLAPAARADYLDRSQLDEYVGCFPYLRGRMGDWSTQGPLPSELGPIDGDVAGWVPVEPGCGPSQASARLARQPVGDGDAHALDLSARIRRGQWTARLGLPALFADDSAVGNGTVGLWWQAWSGFERFVALGAIARVPTSSLAATRQAGAGVSASYVAVSGPISNLERHVMIQADASAATDDAGVSERGLTAIAGIQTNPRPWGSFLLHAANRWDVDGYHAWANLGARFPLADERDALLVLEVALTQELTDARATSASLAISARLPFVDRR